MTYTPLNVFPTASRSLSYDAADRIGTEYYPCDFDKIAAIVMTDIPDKGRAVQPVDDISQKIADNIVELITKETEAGRLPVPLPPLQSGVGGVANAVLAGLKNHPLQISTFT